MGKRSEFKRNERDYYKTPKSAVLPLLPYLKKYKAFAEPCAGDGQLAYILEKHGIICAVKFDIEPQTPYIPKCDALEMVNLHTVSDVIITNPPWEKRKHKGEVFNKLLRHWLKTFEGDIWLLFDADWMHTVQALEFQKYCKTIVSVGRVSWMENGTSGKDNCAWYCFNKNNNGGTRFKFKVKK